MFDQDKFEKDDAFWSSPEGKKVLILGGILIVVILAYAGTGLLKSGDKKEEKKKKTSKEEQKTDKTLEDIQKKWLMMLKDKNPFSPVHKEMMEIAGDLAPMHQNQLVFMALKSDPPDPDMLKSGTSESKGKVIKYSGTLVKTIEKPISIRGQDIYEVWLKNKRNNLYYRLHLLEKPPGYLKENKSRLTGEAIYLNTLKEKPPGMEKSEDPVPVVGLISIKTRTAARRPPEEEPDDEKKTEERPSTSKEKNTRKEVPAHLPPAGDYTKRDRVTSRWNVLLRNVSGRYPLQAGSPIYNRMVNELENVPKDRLRSWVQKDISPELLKNDSTYFRGKVVNFKGTFMTGKLLPVDGRPRDGKGVWSLWIRDFENRVTYVVHTFEKPPEDVEKMSYVKGTGVYVQTPGYELKNPPKGKEGGVSPAVFIMGHNIELDPASVPEEEESNPWVDYLLGGLAAFFLGVFFLVVYLSSRKDAESQTAYRSKLREGRSERGKQKKDAGKSDSDTAEDRENETGDKDDGEQTFSEGETKDENEDDPDESKDSNSDEDSS